MPDLNANDLDAATKIIAGTARSMGVTVDGLELMARGKHYTERLRQDRPHRGLRPGRGRRA